MINEPNKLFITIVLFLYCFTSNVTSMDSDKISRDFIESSSCYNVTSQSELFDSLTFPLSFSFLQSINFTIYNSLFYIYYPGFCVKYDLHYEYTSDAPLSSNLEYNINGSLSYETYVPIICDLPCIPLNNRSIIPNPIRRVTDVSTNASLPVLIPIGIDNLLDLQEYDGKLQTFHSIELYNNITTLYNKWYPNTEQYIDDAFWVLQDGYFLIDSYYFNFRFCPFPYCRSEDGIYPPKFLNIYSINQVLSFGCYYSLPFTYTECSMKREAICESDCPDTFSVYTFNGILNIVNEQGVIIFQNQTSLGAFNWTISNIEPIPPVEDPETHLNEGIAWAGFALGLLIYVLGIIYCIRLIVMKCCYNGFNSL